MLAGGARSSFRRRHLQASGYTSMSRESARSRWAKMRSYAEFVIGGFMPGPQRVDSINRWYYVAKTCLCLARVRTDCVRQLAGGLREESRVARQMPVS